MVLRALYAVSETISLSIFCFSLDMMMCLELDEDELVKDIVVDLNIL